MTPADRQKFLEIVIGFAELKGKQLSAPALELYWGAMQDWSIEAFQTAAFQLLKTCEFMPTPGDFDKLRKANRQSSGEAWAHVLQYVRSGSWRGYNGPGAIAAPSDEVARAVTAMGGYKAIADSDESDLHFREKTFVANYGEVRDNDEARALPHIALTDQSERRNAVVSSLVRKVAV